MKGKNNNFISNFLSSNKPYPVIVAIATGLYPIVFYYSNNYTLVNSWQHLGYFVLTYLLIPVLIFLVANYLKKFLTNKWQKFVLPFLSVFGFLFLLMISIHAGIPKKLALAIFIVSGVVAFFLWRHHKKIVLLQLLMAGIGLVTLIPTVIQQSRYSNSWMELPDNIDEAIFERTPNIYFIQPDGYVNFSELNKGFYNYDNSVFENYLKAQEFTNYDGFRSNYGSTLSTNAAIFTMKHHYYNGGESFSEALNARDAIVGNNAVLRTLERNNYETYFITEKPYLLLNRPYLEFDYCNYSYDEIPFISTGLNVNKDVIPALNHYLKHDSQKSKFFFIEFLNPGHIQNKKSNSSGVEGERNKWFESLNEANRKLVAIIDMIKAKDPEALIMIMADHGGYVGMEYAEMSFTKTDDRDIIYSIFSSALAIHWPNNEIPSYDHELKTSVNVFRVLFSYLSNNTSYLQQMEPNNSYMIIKSGAPEGIYNYINEDGNIIFKKQ